MKIFHIALESDWRQAQRDGAYTTSTLGRSLEEEGFIHASRAEQVKSVNDRTYRGVRKPLVRLDIDTDKLKPTWREDPVEGGDSYPHIYGPLNLDAVTAVKPWHRSGREKQFVEVFLSEALFRISLAIVVMFLAFLGSYVGRQYDDQWGSIIGAVVGLIVGGALYWLTLSQRP